MPVGSKQCPYCLTPQLAKSTRTGRMFVAAGAMLLFAAGAFYILRLVSSTPDVTPEPQSTTQEQSSTADANPQLSGPAEFVPVPYREEKSLTDVYTNLLLASEHNDEERVRNSLSKGAFAEIEKNGYDMMDYATSDLTFDNMKTILQQENGKRALLVFTGTSAVITDAQGNPANAVGVYRFEWEDGRWKVLSLVWHIHPPNDPVLEARQWLEQKS